MYLGCYAKAVVRLLVVLGSRWDEDLRSIYRLHFVCHVFLLTAYVFDISRCFFFLSFSLLPFLISFPRHRYKFPSLYGYFPSAVRDLQYSSPPTLRNNRYPLQLEVKTKKKKKNRKQKKKKAITRKGR